MGDARLRPRPDNAAVVGANGSRRSDRSRQYRITIEGELSERFASEFEGMTLESRHGKTFLCGNVADQSHLHGVLARIQDLGLVLVGVDEVPQTPYSGEEGTGMTGRHE